jgi:hypothetical protein
MKKIFPLLALLIACGSTPSKVPEPPSCADAKAGEICTPSPAPIEAITTQIIRGDDWSITLPLTYTVQRQPLLLPEGVSVKTFADRAATRMVAITRMDNAVSRMPAAMFLGKFIAYFTSDGTVVVGAPREILINGKPLSKVEFNKEMVKIFVFITQDSGIAHVVMCGGKIADTQIETACSSLMNTFKMD